MVSSRRSVEPMLHRQRSAKFVEIICRSRTPVFAKHLRRCSGRAYPKRASPPRASSAAPLPICCQLYHNCVADSSASLKDNLVIVFAMSRAPLGISCEIGRSCGRRLTGAHVPLDVSKDPRRCVCSLSFEALADEWGPAAPRVSTQAPSWVRFAHSRAARRSSLMWPRQRLNWDRSVRQESQTLASPRWTDVVGAIEHKVRRRFEVHRCCLGPRADPD
jgi:hypothetical protein